MIIQDKIINQLSIAPASNKQLVEKLGYAYSTIARFTREMAEEYKLKVVYHPQGNLYSIIDTRELRFGTGTSVSGTSVSLDFLLERTMGRAVEQGRDAAPHVKAIATYGTFIVDLTNGNSVSLEDFPTRAQRDLKNAIEQTKEFLTIMEQIVTTPQLWERAEVTNLVDGPAFAKLARDCHGELRI